MSSWFKFLHESLYVYARLHTIATKEEEVEEDDEIDGSMKMMTMLCVRSSETSPDAILTSSGDV